MSRKLQLRYSPTVKERDLIGHVMGPDQWGAHYYVVTVFELPEETVVNLLPLPHRDMDSLIRNEWGQYKVGF